MSSRVAKIRNHLKEASKVDVKLQARFCSSSSNLTSKVRENGEVVEVQDLHPLVVTQNKIDKFWQDGFVLIENVLPYDLVCQLRDRFEDLFAGKFGTGIYPDEWHWREGISQPNAFREIVNAWKADSLVASIVLSDRLGCLASDVMHWECGARLAQDDILWKPPQSKGVGYHQDGPYIASQFSPETNNSITIWIALDDANEDTGVVEYARGSHKWANNRSTTVSESSFHGEDDYTSALQRNLPPEMKDKPDIVKLNVKAGDAVIHHQDTWHGSGDNKTMTTPRRALGVHLVQANVQWRRDRKPDYIYGRYYIPSETRPRGEFFPLVYIKDEETTIPSE
eukprot:CAMPEP_0204857524 /NCGR_PEP_ID=MMETSP1347-20130617/20794_1 /ASSEMBLY_ACC=CAM_ASM_000690 /TAXON_ID=215587 /ORGANISM="Aplanochytrium stocchinoi, Strain GSBS06" /LENGTH=337 /DNA_ID=CAMNT_0052004955 /DNA_START=8 /DNA_END=1021 /DNA_ORIENTATION=-